MATTLRDVAALAGVSFKTVSNVLNDYPFISSTTRAKVLDAIDRLDYTPNHAARTLRAGRTGSISFAVPDLAQSYWGEIAAEVTARADRAGLRVLVEQTNGSRARELEILAGASRHVTDGLVLSPLSLTPDDLSSLRRTFPLVLLGESLFPDAVDHITMRNTAAAAAATMHLLESGRRRIAFVGAGSDTSLGHGTSALRQRGHVEALASQGLHSDPALMLPAGGFDAADGERAMRDLVGSGTGFDAVFAITDELALGAIRGLRDAGRSVPDDVAVIGFDDIAPGRYSAPSLTTVDPGRTRIAELAVETLLQRIEEPSAPVRFVEVPFTLVRRESA